MASDECCGHHEFAATLRGAIARRGVSLADLQAALGARGVRVGRSTLSYWQSGARHPTRASIDVVRQLEDLLALAPGTLVEAVVAHRRVADCPPHRQHASGSVERLVREIGCRDALSAIDVAGVLEVLVLDATGAAATLHSLHAVTATRSVGRYPALVAGPSLGPPDRIFGARVGRSAYDQPAQLTATELRLDPPLTRRESRALRLSRAGGPRPVRSLLVPVVGSPCLIALEVGFHSDRLPVWIDEVERVGDRRPDDIRRRRTLGVDRRVSLVRERAARGWVGFRWEFP